MADAPRIALLQDIADQIPDDRQSKILTGLSRRIVISHSCLTDLKYCANLLELLEKGFVATGIDEQGRLLLLHSVICNASVLYARATNGGSMYGGRGSIDVVPKLSEEERKSHRFIVDFRNKVIAHVHIGHDMEGYAWNPSYAVAVDEEDGFRLGAVSRPLSMREEIWNHLRLVTPVSLEIVRAIYDKYLDRASELLDDLHDPDPIFACMQDSAKLLGSKESAVAVLGGRADGSTVGVGRED